MKEQGYLTVRDGTRLRYTVVRPASPPGTRFPVLLNYQGYEAGSDPQTAEIPSFGDELFKRGYALVGVSVRGTGCSEGVADLLSPVWSTDGYDAIEWIASQSWSDGNVGMIGYSFGGFMQTLVAAARPPHLRAISPISAIGDLYRDVGYPGGVFNVGFAALFGVGQKFRGADDVPGEVTRENPECASDFAAHEIANRDYFAPQVAANSPFIDSTAFDWDGRAPELTFSEIQVPVLLQSSWQDEAVSARIWNAIDRFRHRERVWLNFGNGNHARPFLSPPQMRKTMDFYDRFVRGIPNGFENNTARLELAGDVVKKREVRLADPTWVLRFDKVPDPSARTFYLRSRGRLSEARPTADEGSDSYLYSLPSGQDFDAGWSQIDDPNQTGKVVWKTPQLAGAVAYTTAPLDRDLVVLGPASLDLWLQSTAKDTDLEVTVTELRPDGQETYVQRGWLRASHRKLDERASTPLLPVQTHKESDAAELVPGAATPVRVEVFPFSHAFRRGSRLRIWIEAPASMTGYRAFALTPDAAVNTVLHDRDHRSRLVLGEMEGTSAGAPLPGCDTLLSQPCRPDPLALSP